MTISVWLLRVVALSMMALLAACGGGGGGAEAPKEAPKEARANILSVTVPTATDSNIVASVTVTDAATVAQSVVGSCDGKSVALTATVLPVTGGTITVAPMAPYAGACEVTVGVTASGVVGAIATDTETVRFQAGQVKLSYQNVTFSMAGAPVLLTKAGVVELENGTGYPQRPFGCMMSEKPFDTGHRGFLCLVPALDQMRVLAVDPTTKKYTIWSGALPTGYEYKTDGPATGWTVGPKWHACMGHFCPDKWEGTTGVQPSLDMSAWASDGEGGWFYADNVRDSIARHRSNTGVETVVDQRTDGRGYPVMDTGSF